MFKKRSKFGRFLDTFGIKQERVREVSKLNRETVSRACNDDEYIPNGGTIRSLMQAARKLTGKDDIDPTKFWPM
ncbi:transcriptional regulator [Paenibacillus cremeus]|nr:transcriptional regulator [Paenibacillus cremeus]